MRLNTSRSGSGGFRGRLMLPRSLVSHDSANARSFCSQHRNSVMPFLVPMLAWCSRGWSLKALRFRWGHRLAACTGMRSVYSVTTLRVRFVPSQPRDWCYPRESFGRLDAPGRQWLPPDPAGPALAVSKFRAAVMQLAVREFKTVEGVAQEELARRDLRSDAMNMWNARLCGRANLSTQDMVTLMMVLPGAKPSEEAIRAFVDVAEGSAPRPKYWGYPDTSRARPGG